MYILWNGVAFSFFSFFSLCELNIWSGSSCFVVEAFELEVVVFYLVIYFGYVAGQEYCMYV